MKKSELIEIEKKLVTLVNTSGIEYATYGYSNEHGYMVKVGAIRSFLSYIDDLKQDAE